MTSSDLVASRSGHWNAPNIITLSRILATPFFLWVLLAGGSQPVLLRWGAAAFFVLAIATDAWDGYLARSRGLVTELGKLLDPIADKVLTGAALVGLSILGELPWWVSVIILVREIGITVHRLIVVRVVVMAAAWMGKVKTVVQSLALTLALAPLAAVFDQFAAAISWVNTATMSVACLLTVISGVDYVFSYWRTVQR